MNSNKKLCVVHANCQSGPLLELLRLSPDFSRFWEVRLYTNYLREDIPDEALEQCELFLYQYLGNKWDNLSSKTLLGKLGPKCTPICLPNMFFKGYWPFWTHISPIDFGDTLLDRFIDAGADKAAIIKLYYHSNIEKYADFNAIARACICKEHEKDKLSPIKTAALLEEYWQSEMLFYTCNHPGKRLLLHTACELFKLLGLTPLSARDEAEFIPEYADFELPIHPQVAAALKLGFISEGQTFNVFGRSLSFIQYISRYIDCRHNGFADGFLGYLQLI